jgi:hypothetical protein
MESQPTFPAFLIAMRKELNSSITEKNAETAETASLTTEYHTNLGDVQINYNKYLHKVNGL